MSTPTVKELLRDSLQKSKTMYLQDLEAMSHEHLSKSPGGSARTPYDFTYETAVVNRRIAKRLRGEDPGPPPFGEWPVAPPEFQDKDTAMKELEASANDVIAGWDATPEHKLTEKIPLPKGETSPLDMAKLAAVHMSYHDAQLNNHQAICGDDQVHWKQD
ncbi:MAG: DinB family protein [Fimbriimonadaceae bacterium]|nr:DinB family protein [Chthonomonadaceae bacterium]MCO5297132.1 DinB family protein [Fimbriimonadaceae bacterium]